MSLTAKEIEERLISLRAEIPEGVELVAVSKFQPVEAVKAAWNAGQLIFGESRVQELLVKIPLLPTDIKWHFIGHLQTNKIRSLIGKTALIESVDSERLLRLIDEESRKQDVATNVLLQLHVAAEETKFGFSPEELIAFFTTGGHHNLTHTRICGLMTMATNTDDETRIRQDFACAASAFREVRDFLAKESVGHMAEDFARLSMGMSGDWTIAVEEGATLIRVGSAIFGNRN